VRRVVKDVLGGPERRRGVPKSRRKRSETYRFQVKKQSLLLYFTSSVPTAHLQMEETVFIVSTGYFPRSVSAPSRMPSTPSSTALATSVASARVGLEGH